MTFIPYIYVVKENGFITGTKLQNELDLLTVRQGDKITSFYDEVDPLYNISYKNADNKHAFFEKGQLTFLSQDDIVEKITNLFPLLINQIASSGVNDLLNDYKKADGSIDRKSVFKEYLEQISWKTKYEIIPVIEEFSLEKYRNLANELHFLSESLDSNKSILGHFVKASINGFNTFLAYDNIITDVSYGLFSTYRDEETGEEKISFSQATAGLHYAENICNEKIQLGNKKEEQRKPKF